MASLERDALKPVVARELVASLASAGIVLPVQVLGELYRVLVGKAGHTPADARAAVSAWSNAFPTLDTSNAVMLAAVELSASHQLSIWDAVVLAAAAGAGCRLLLSEDMHDGFSWRGLTVVDPFSTDPHPLLAALTQRPS